MKCNYTTTEKELLSIVQAFNDYEFLLHTSHHNLTNANLNLQCIICWHLLIEEFYLQFHYIPGSNNVLADALSRIQQNTEGENTIDKTTTE